MVADACAASQAEGDSVDRSDAEQCKLAVTGSLDHRCSLIRCHPIPVALLLPQRLVVACGIMVTCIEPASVCSGA